MPRNPRIHVPGGYYHVILRGNNRGDIFLTGQDRKRLEGRFEDGLKRYGGRIHAYCWMTNHIHLVLQVEEQPVGNIMRWVASGYARQFNKTNKRRGHLFERRHKAILVQADSYLLALVRYIHINPTKAGVVKSPEDYRWSSYPAYLGLRDVPWLTTAMVLQQFGGSLAKARKAFHAFTVNSNESDFDFENGSPEDGRILGNDDFRVSVQSEPGPPMPNQTIDELICDYCSAQGISIAELTGPSRRRSLAQTRAYIADQALQGGMATLAEISRAFNRSDAVTFRTLIRWREKHRR
jgi:REP element-mobilizing transposase RayT